MRRNRLPSWRARDDHAASSVHQCRIRAPELHSTWQHGRDHIRYREEWLGLLSAVEEASDTMVAVELGAGWGPWLVAAHVAARQRGIHDIHLIGVEACKEHADWMRQHFIDNDIEPDRHNLIYGAIGPEDGTAWFPMIDPLTNWGQSAHFHPGS